MDVAALSSSAFASASFPQQSSGQQSDTAREIARITAEITSAQTEAQCATCEDDKEDAKERVKELQTELRALQAAEGPADASRSPAARQDPAASNDEAPAESRQKPFDPEEAPLARLQELNALARSTPAPEREADQAFAPGRFLDVTI